MSHVALDQAQKTLPELIEEVQRGERVVITKNDDPVAEIVPVGMARPKPKPAFGSAKGLIRMAEDFDAPPEDFAEYME